MTTSYWIWSNVHGGWRTAHRDGYTQQLHEAGRFVEHVALQLVQAGNERRSRVEYPDLVMVEVNNAFLTPQAQEIMKLYQDSGQDRRVIDDAFFAAQDQALRDSPNFRESVTQMSNGQGRVLKELPTTARES